ncbi:MAG: acetylornithine transaminase [Myxococcota bacterium]
MTDTASWLEQAEACMTPNYRPAPMVISHGDGAQLWDLDGRRYLDFSSGIGVTQLGHAHPRVVQAIRSQAGKVCHTANMVHQQGYIEVCQRLTELSFGDKVFLANSGTEAVEAALKISRRHFFDRHDNRTGFVAAVGSFHGRTYGAVTLTGQPTVQRGMGPLLPNVEHVPYDDADAMRSAVGRTTAAVLLEPIQGNSGVLIPQPGYLAAVREICDAAGCLLIFDEVQTGTGRTGRWFAHDHEGVTPDIMTLAKGLGGGLPLGAMVTTDEIAAALQPGVHASTLGGNPVACAAALATMDVIRDDHLLDNATRTGAKLIDRLRDTLGPRDGAVEVRGRGLMIGIELHVPAAQVKNACFERGLLTTTAGSLVLRLLPPLIIGDDEVDSAVGIIGDAIADTTDQCG